MPAPGPFSTLPSVLAAALLLAGTVSARADWRDDVGFTRLNQTFTSGVPRSVTAGVTQVEAGDANGNAYLPNAADSRFSGKTIFNKSTGTGSSGHATGVGAYFYGNTSSLIPDTPQVDAYNANHWLNSLPYTEPRLVQNHSWVARASGFTAGTDLDATAKSINARVDYMANQGAIVVAGVDNGFSTTLPVLLAQGYNLISVGLTNGQHSAGFTAYDTAGRIKPDLVAPDSVTSNSTPQVASTAGLLAQKLTESPYSLTGAHLPRTVKALLLAGATKDEIASWTRSTTQPIDTRRGAGELNVHLAYRTLLAGPVAASNSQLRPDTAWANALVRNNTNPNARTFFFDVPAGATQSRFSAALVWHRQVTAQVLGGYSTSLADLNLTLHEVDAATFTLGSVLQSSESTVDNLEHLYVPALPAGRYALVVSSSSPVGTDYALAWRTLPTVTVVATTPVARELDDAHATFTVSRTGPTDAPLFIPLAWGGTAVSGSHYTTPPSALLIPAGSAAATIDVTPVSDSLAQGDRTVTLTLASDFSLSAGTPASATATIEDKPFDAWRHARFTAAQLADAAVSGDGSDPDSDGLGNLLEYALAGDPLLSDASALQPVPGTDAEGRLTLAYLHAADRPDLVYAVEWTTDLAVGPWQGGDDAVTEISRVATESGELVTVRADATPATAPRQFLRLRVTRE